MAQGESSSSRVQEAKKLHKTDPHKAEQTYKSIIAKKPSVTSDAAVREYETALVSLGELYRDQKCVGMLSPGVKLADYGVGKRRIW